MLGFGTASTGGGKVKYRVKHRVKHETVARENP
jgi:hypothetical protein